MTAIAILVRIAYITWKLLPAPCEKRGSGRFPVAISGEHGIKAVFVERKRYHIVIASIVFAVIMWVSVNLGDEYTIVKRVPIVLENLKDGKALRHPIPSSVNVRFKGKGWSLMGLYLSPDINYYIDLSTVGAEDYVVTGRDLLEHIKLPVYLQPLDVKPDTMVLALDDYWEKVVPVVSQLAFEFRDGYGQVGSAHLTPDSVKLGGSQRLIGRIMSWPTEYRKFQDLHTPVDAEIPLEASGTISIDVSPQTAKLKVNVQPFAEKIFAGVPIVASGVPLNREIIFIPPRVDLVVRGGIEQLAKLTNDDFQASVSYDELLRDSTGAIIPAIAAPGGVKILSRKPEQFQFVIRKKL